MIFIHREQHQAEGPKRFGTKGKLAFSFSIVLEIFLAVASALEPGRWVTSSATADFRNRKLLVV